MFRAPYEDKGSCKCRMSPSTLSALSPLKLGDWVELRNTKTNEVVYHSSNNVATFNTSPLISM